MGAAAGALQVTEEVEAAGGGELSPASSAGCGGHRATPPSCLKRREGRAQVWTETQELRDMELGHRHKQQGWGQQNMRNTGQDSQPAAGGPLKQLQPLWMALGEGKAKPVGGEHCAL